MPQQRRASQTVELNDDEAARLQTLVRTAIDHLEARLATGDDPSHAQAYLDRALLRSMTRQLSGLEPDPCEPPRAAAALAAANDQAAHRMAALSDAASSAAALADSDTAAALTLLPLIADQARAAIADLRSPAAVEAT